MGYHFLLQAPAAAHSLILAISIYIQALPTPSLSGPGTPLLQWPVNPLQNSCLENPMGRGAWWARVHRVPELHMTEATYHAGTTYTNKHLLLTFQPPVTPSLSITLLLISLRKLKASKSRPLLYIPAPHPCAAPLFCWILQEGEARDGCPAQNCTA